MRARFHSLAGASFIIVAVIVFVAGAGAGRAAAPLTVHEWGTFTTVAGAEGQAVEWAPFSGPQDLPCFVSELSPNSVKYIGGPQFVTFLPPINEDPGLAARPASELVLNGWLPSLRATVRMETPVLYFYSPVETNVSVSVRFPQGLISEWYPRAAVPAVAPVVNLRQTTGGITWNSVQVVPKSTESFPTDWVKSHYYAARATDAAPVRVDGQVEKFLFYRGLADFPVAISATLGDDDQVSLRNSGPLVPYAILFENDGKRMGFRLVGSVGSTTTVGRPMLAPITNQVDEVAIALEHMLTTQGLYEKEAKAMIATWRDSWFEPGLRLIYAVPRTTADAVLPLTITPAPADIERVFVGRSEIITGDAIADVGAALRAKDTARLMTYGRFLEPIANRVLEQMAMKERMDAVATLRLVANTFTAHATVCK